MPRPKGATMKNKFKLRSVILVSLVLLLITLVSTASLVACKKKNNDASESLSDGGGKVTLTFVVNGGKDIPEITAESGSEITLPEAEKNHRIFLGWYLKADFSGEKATKITLNGNMSVYARWGVTVTFDPSGGTAVDNIVVGENRGIIKNVNLSGRGGALNLSLARSLNCYVGYKYIIK